MDAQQAYSAWCLKTTTKSLQSWTEVGFFQWDLKDSEKANTQPRGFISPHCS